MRGFHPPSAFWLPKQYLGRGRPAHLSPARSRRFILDVDEDGIAALGTEAALVRLLTELAKLVLSEETIAMQRPPSSLGFPTKTDIWRLERSAGRKPEAIAAEPTSVVSSAPSQDCASAM